MNIATYNKHRSARFFRTLLLPKTTESARLKEPTPSSGQPLNAAENKTKDNDQSDRGENERQQTKRGSECHNSQDARFY